jgi:hypothetical protein
MEGYFGLSEFPDLKHPWNCSSSIETADGGRCSGTFISAEGHFLTALHCLGKWLTDLDLAVVEERPGAIKIMKVHNQNPLSMAKASGFYLGDRPAVRDPWLYRLGRGIQYLEAEHISRLADGEIDEINWGYDDWAILKFELRGEQVPFARIARHRLAAGEPVWHISKPYANRRGSDGSTKYITSGEVIGLAQSPAFARRCCDGCARDKLLHYFGSNRVFATVDFNYGSSGGGLFNQAGELIGLNAISLHDPGSEFVAGGAGFHLVNHFHSP